MQRAIGVAPLAVALALLAASASGQPRPDAKVCKLLPVAELEVLFGAKAARVSGNDAAAMSLCSASFGDVRRSASVNTRPPSPGDTMLGVEGTLNMVKAGIKEEGGFESKVFGSVGCMKHAQEMGDTPLPSTTCFLLEGGSLAMAVSSDDPKVASYETVKDLLETAAARRK
jgi:hypothetical protein